MLSIITVAVQANISDVSRYTFALLSEAPIERAGVQSTSAATPAFQAMPRLVLKPSANAGSMLGMYMRRSLTESGRRNTAAISQSFVSIDETAPVTDDHTTGSTIRDDVNTGIVPRLIQINARIIKDATGVARMTESAGDISARPISQRIETAAQAMPRTAPAASPAHTRRRLMAQDIQN